MFLCNTDCASGLDRIYNHVFPADCTSSISTDSGPVCLVCYMLLLLSLLLTQTVQVFDFFMVSCFSTPAVETPDNLPFPDGKEVSPEIIVETLPGNGCPMLDIQLSHVQILTNIKPLWT